MNLIIFNIIRINYKKRMPCNIQYRLHFLLFKLNDDIGIKKSERMSWLRPAKNINTPNYLRTDLTGVYICPLRLF